MQLAPPRARASATAVAAVLAAALALASCSSSGSAARGPLTEGTDTGTVCVPYSGAERRVTVGVDLVENPSSAPAVIDGVALVGAKGLRLVEARTIAVPPGPSTLLGTSGSYPPRSDPRWSMAAVASGTSVAPGATQNVVLGLEAPDGAGSAKRVRISYHVGSEHYVLATNYAYQVQGSPCS